MPVAATTVGGGGAAPALEEVILEDLTTVDKGRQSRQRNDESGR